MFKFYEVGGKIRDELLGLKSKDYDYSVVYTGDLDIPIENVFIFLKNELNKEGYEIFLETPQCQTIRARFPKTHKLAGITADFVIARKELGYKEGTREPIVVPGTLYDDLERRDFRMNAVAKDVDTGEYIDPFNGMQDIKDKILRTPINGNITFQDDPLRLLRALRFSITKGFRISEEIDDTMLEFPYFEKMCVVSEERVREELFKCFKFNTLLTLERLTLFPQLREYIFKGTKLWLKPTTEL